MKINNIPSTQNKKRNNSKHSNYQFSSCSVISHYLVYASLTVNDKILRPKMTVATDPELRNLLRAGTGYKARRACDFFLALATCNTIVPIEVDTSDPSVKLIDYQGESPDEQALVYAAAAYGFVLIERTSGHIIIDIFGERQRYFLTYHLS